MKVCRKCNKELSVSLFSKNKNYSDGLDGQCKDCVKDRTREWRQKNHEKDIKRKIKWRNENLDYDKQRKAKWSAENLDKRRMSYHKRQAALMGNSYYISEKEVKKILKSLCFYCGSNQNIQIDHVIPVSKGGKHSIGNIVPACRSCNASKCDKYIFQWKKNKKFDNKEKI